MLKNVAQLVHTRHRSVHNFLMNLLAAMGAYCFFQSKPAVNFDYEVPNSDGTVHHLAIAKIPFSQKPIRRPRPWSPDTMSASESRLFSPRLSRTRVRLNIKRGSVDKYTSLTRCLVDVLTFGCSVDKYWGAPKQKT